MRKSILIFGAGLNQLTLINAAKELGLISIVLDPNPSASGKDAADFFYCVPGNDYEITKKIALKHNASGIVTSQMEKPMLLMAKLANELGFVFHSPEVTERSLDKWLMKQAFLKHNVPCAKGNLFKAGEDITEDKQINDFTFPLVIKPKDAHSSQGVYKIESFKELIQFRKRAEAFSSTAEIIIEEYLNGPEFSVESITFQGKTTIVQYTEKYITPFPSTVEIGHLQPALLTKDEKRMIDEIVIAAIDAIGINNSAAHTEVKLAQEGPKIIEVGARLGGDFISSYLVLNSCGVNMDKAAIQVALGYEPDLTPNLMQFSYIKYFRLPSGMKVKSIGNWQRILDNPDVVFANVSIKEGMIVADITESSKRAGFVIVKGIDRDEVIKKAIYYEEEIINYIIFEG